MFENLIAIYSTKTAHTSPVYLYKPLMLQSKRPINGFPQFLFMLIKSVHAAAAAILAQLDGVSKHLELNCRWKNLQALLWSVVMFFLQ